jgi:cytosine/adenosine deaminase-related metal-dependent hydrolase
LIALGALVPGSILAHGVHLTRDEVSRAADAGAWFVQNARSNRGNRVGYPACLTAAPRVALGTDGYPADMLAEARVAVETGASHGEPPALAYTRLRHGHALAASLFDLPAPAVPAPATASADAAGDALAAARAACLAHYEADGRAILHDGRLLTADLDALRAEARREAPRLWARLREVSS